MWVYGLWLAVAAFFPIFGCAEESGIWSGKADVGWFTDTEADGAYTISTAEQLAGLALLVNSGTGFEGKTVTLGGDIWLNDTAGWQGWDSATAGLKQWTPIGVKIDKDDKFNAFKGVFNGDGHTIYGLYISAGERGGQGFFSVVDSNSVIKNVGISYGYVKGGDHLVGFLAGGNLGDIKDSHVNGNVIGDWYVGGLVGGNWGTISNCYANGDVRGVENVGGLVGHNGNYTETDEVVGGGIINNSYANGDVSGNVHAGGLVGENRAATISNSYAAGMVSGSASVFVGGLSAANYRGGIISNSYYDSQISGVHDNEEDGIPKTTSEMQSQKFVNILNAGKDVWVYKSGQYPSLKR